MTNNTSLDFAVEQFKQQMSKTKIDKSKDWKEAYLNKIDKQTQSINREEQYKRTV